MVINRPPRSQVAQAGISAHRGKGGIGRPRSCAQVRPAVSPGQTLIARRRVMDDIRDTNEAEVEDLEPVEDEELPEFALMVDLRD
ncbi:hypothetical protein GCM10017688_06140 [Streptomyces ramulosus]